MPSVTKEEEALTLPVKYHKRGLASESFKYCVGQLCDEGTSSDDVVGTAALS